MSRDIRRFYVLGYLIEGLAKARIVASHLDLLEVARLAQIVSAIAISCIPVANGVASYDIATVDEKSKRCPSHL